MEEFTTVIENVNIQSTGFTIQIKDVNHEFVWMQGGIAFPNYDFNTYIMTETQFNSIKYFP